MRRRHPGLATLIAALVLLAVLAPAASAGQSSAPAAPDPAAPSLVYIPFIAAPDGFQPVTLAVKFWAERYALPAGGCTTLHWQVQGAKSVAFNGSPAAANETREACPGGTEFYQLQVTALNDVVTLYDIVLTAGDPGLGPDEVIAQGKVASLAPVADTDPTQPGDQAGYRLQLSGVKALYAGTPGWNEASVTLDVPQMLIDYAPVGAPVDWPITAGQTVEFRATCGGASCLVNANGQSYLYLTSE